MIIVDSDVWFAKFPLEEDNSQYFSRPVIILNSDRLEVLVIKVTKTAPRTNDKYDIPIMYWQYANLRFKSTARVAKAILLSSSQLEFKIGTLHPSDFANIEEAFIQFISENG